jgi:hypothetical protein
MRVICRAEASAQEVDLRFIVTNCEEAGTKYLYKVVYRWRRKMELKSDGMNKRGEVRKI